MLKENMNQEFGLKKVDEIRNCLIEEINQNKSISKKHKKRCRVLNYIDHILIVISAISGCVSISTFASLVSIAIGITSYTIGLKTYAIIAGIKKYMSIINKEKKKYDKTILLSKPELSSIENLICKALIDPNVSHDEFVLINNVLKKVYDIKEGIKNPNNK